MKAMNLGMALGAMMLASVGVANAQQVVRVGFLAYVPPTQLIDPVTHAPSGAAVELINAVGKDAGFRAEFHVLNVGDIIPALNANIIDISAASQFTPAFKDEGMLFSEPVYSNSEGLIVNKDDTKDYKSLDDLKGEVVGTSLGGPQEEELKKSGLFKEVRTYTGSFALYEAVSKGEIKAGFRNAMGVADDMKHGLYPGVRQPASYQPRFVNASGFMAGKNGGDLLKRINTSLAKLKADGTVKTIFTKYGIDFALVK